MYKENPSISGISDTYRTKFPVVGKEEKTPVIDEDSFGFSEFIFQKELWLGDSQENTLYDAHSRNQENIREALLRFIESEY